MSHFRRTDAPTPSVRSIHPRPPNNPLKYRPVKLAAFPASSSGNPPLSRGELAAQVFCSIGIKFFASNM